MQQKRISFKFHKQNKSADTTNHTRISQKVWEYFEPSIHVQKYLHVIFAPKK